MKNAQVKSGTLLYTGLGLLVFGIVFATIAGFLAASTASFLDRAQPTTGVVTDLEEDREREDDGEVRLTYRPEVSFEVGGVEHRFTDRNGSNPPRFDVGDQVPVLYDPADPDDARLDQGFPYLMETIFGLVALVVLIAGTVVTTIWSRAAARRRRAAARSGLGPADGRGVIFRP